MDVWPAAPPATGIVFSALKSYAGAKAFSVPCGQCMSCRLSKAQEWATRIAHENSSHDDSCFVTLTFGDTHLPVDRSVSVRDLQLFMKRLRKAVGHARIRYFGCGEYGDTTLRPHYHILLFGWRPPDLLPWRKSSSGFVVYRSAFLESVWPFGHVEVGSVTAESSGYVARYIIKKASGNDEVARAQYRRTNPETGEEWEVQREFIVMSTRPGIGSAWFDQFKDDAFPSDFVIIDGVKRPVPRYYTRKLADLERAKVTQQRKANAAKHAENNTTRRLLTRDESAQIRATRLKRQMEEET